jgi:glycosyltransferase involved in cell wall biosynthesis
MKQHRNVSIIIPAYNEENTLAEVLDKICRLEFVQQIILVDDHSSDNTYQIGLTYQNQFPLLEVYRHEINQGKTAAIKTALKHLKGEISLIQDADLEYDPDEIIHICDPIWNNRADVVYGSRFLVRKASRVLYFYHYLANKSLTFLCNLLTNKNMTDIETCYKAFRTPLLKEMPITSSGFGFEVEVTANISKTKARIYEVPISYYGRTYDEGKKIHVSDGVAALWYILRYNLFWSSDRKEYLVSSGKFLNQ